MKYAVAVEIQPGSTSIESFSRDLVEMSLGNLARVDPGSLKIASLTKGPTNQAMRCINYGVPILDAKAKDPMGVDGAFNLEKVSKDDPEFGKALVEGIEWLVISCTVVDMFPKLAHMVQAEGNTEAQTQRHEHELQVLLRIHNEAVDMQRGSGTIDWDSIMRSVCKSKPPCKSYVAQLCKFVEACSGGDGGVQLEELAKFHKLHCENSTALKGEMYQALANLDVGITTPCVLFRGAMAKTCFLSTLPVSVVKGCGGAITKNLVKEAEVDLRQCRGALAELAKQSINFLDHEVSQVLGRLYARMVRLVIKSKLSEFNNMWEICHEFYKDLAAAAETDEVQTKI